MVILPDRPLLGGENILVSPDHLPAVIIDLIGVLHQPEGGGRPPLPGITYQFRPGISAVDHQEKIGVKLPDQAAGEVLGRGLPDQAVKILAQTGVDIIGIAGGEPRYSRVDKENFHFCHPVVAVG